MLWKIIKSYPIISPKGEAQGSVRALPRGSGPFPQTRRSRHLPCSSSPSHQPQRSNENLDPPVLWTRQAGVSDRRVKARAGEGIALCREGGRMGPLLWSQDGPRSLEETAEGSRAATPKSPATAPTAWRQRHSPVTPREKQAPEVEGACVSQHPMPACHDVHTLGKRRSKRSGN